MHNPDELTASNQALHYVQALVKPHRGKGPSIAGHNRITMAAMAIGKIVWESSALAFPIISLPWDEDRNCKSRDSWRNFLHENQQRIPPNSPSCLQENSPQADIFESPKLSETRQSC